MPPSGFERQFDDADQLTGALPLCVRIVCARLHPFEPVEQQIGKHRRRQSPRPKAPFQSELPSPSIALAKSSTRRSRQPPTRSPARLFFISSISAPCGELWNVSMSADQGRLEQPFGYRSAQAALSATVIRAFSMGIFSRKASLDSSIDIRFVSKEQIKRGARNVGGARDVVHCRAGEP